MGVLNLPSVDLITQYVLTEEGTHTRIHSELTEVQLLLDVRGSRTALMRRMERVRGHVCELEAANNAYYRLLPTGE